MTLPVLAEPSFIERDPGKVIMDMAVKFEADSGRTLYPAQAERLMVNQIAYRESLLREAIQDVGMQNLLLYARGVTLDHLGLLVGAQRLAATPATATLRYVFPASFGVDVIMPAGLRVSNAAGTIIFATDNPATLPRGSTTLDIPASCQSSGVGGNGYVAGQIATIMDDAGVTGLMATNIGTTGSGYETEDDDRYRERIALAPAAFSTAGSIKAYRYHAFSAHASIVDVGIPLPDGSDAHPSGTVKLYILTAAGLPSTPILNAVEVACSAEKVRPLCDTVLALQPVLVPYNIEVNVVILSAANPDDIRAEIGAALAAYAAKQASGLGLDIVVSQISALASISGVYSVAVVSPSSNLSVSKSEWASCSSIIVNITGISDG